jgi:LacI family transcriptional regulator
MLSQSPKVILLIESSRASGRALLRGIASYSHQVGPWSFYWEPGGLEKAWPMLESLDADGIILRDGDKLEEVLSFGIPAVVVGHSKREVPGLANVITDSPAIGHMAADHLLDCGFRHFAYCGYEHTQWSQLRAEAFTQTIRERGYPTNCYNAPAESDPVSWTRERQSMARWLQSLPKPLGLMACNDDRGQQVIEACHIAGLRIPDEVAVLGTDNDEVVCGLSGPPMSSVAINFDRAGYDAAQCLHRMMSGQKRLPSKISVPPTHVVTRRSTDILATEDPFVAKSLRFIRDHPRQDVSVGDVARAAGLSRRALEKRFRRMIGRSILKEIRRVRVDQIARLLVETNLPIVEIAELSGYSNVQHFARYFRAERNTTPLAFRRLNGQK